MFYHPLTYRPVHPAQRPARSRFSPATVPVNIHETSTGYELQLLAPGRQKTDFKISVAADKTLLISHNTPTPAQPDYWLHQEFNLTPFSRSVKLSEQVDASAITATYESGILTISIPKRPEETPVQKEIPVN
ncbi:MAG: Hsp20/alpha crystallin family protein [Sphingobacteriales bacterium]|nr:MAG: Hsp20/alpha crystallin family protein [Sphingobacteriales bacterium]